MTSARWQRFLYSNLLRLRPAPFAALVKKALRIRRREIQTQDGLRFWADPASHFGLEILRDGTYEPKLSELFHAVLRPGDTFVDIGGNEGYFSMLASRLVGEGQVHCIEPQQRLHEVLEKNRDLNVATNVRLHELALASENDTRTLYLHADTNTGATSFIQQGRFPQRAQQVATRTLDTFFVDNEIREVRLMKVDCEGAETLVVPGGKSVFEQKRVAFLALEYHAHLIGHEACTRIHTQLARAGYQLTAAGTLWVYHRPGLEKELTRFPALTRIEWREDGQILRSA